MASPHIEDPEARITVLHVDDKHAQRNLTKSFIERADPNLTVVSVGTADEALNLLGDGGFECVVSDYKMPGIDGIEFARRIRESSDVPYILYTGHGSEEVAERAFSVGIDDYLRKELDPSHYQVLVKRIRSAVEKHRTEVQLRESLLTTASIFDKIPSGLFIYQYEPPDRLVLVDANPESHRLTGLRMEDWGGREFSEIWQYDSEVGLKDRYLELITSGRALRLENVFWDDERVTGYFRIHAFPIPGDRIAVAFENITERVSYEKRLEALHRHASQMSQARTIEDVTWTTLRAIESALGFDRGGLGFVRKGFIRFNNIGDLAEINHIPLDGHGITVKAYRTGEVQLIPDTREEEEFISSVAANAERSLSELDVPVKVDGEVRAMINVESKKLNAFTEQDVKLLETLAMHISSALRRLKERTTRTAYSDVPSVLDENMRHSKPRGALQV